MYQTLIESLTEGVFVAQDHRFVFVNPALPAMLGYSVDDFVGLPFDAVVAPEHLELWTGRYELRMGEGPEPSWDYEVCFLCRTGVRLWVELTARRIHFQGRTAVLGIIRDIGNRKELQERELRARENAERVAGLLAKAHALLDTIFAGAPIGLGLWDPELRFVRLNAKLAEIGGGTAEDHLGRTLREMWPGIAEMGPLYATLRTVLETGEATKNLELSEIPAGVAVRKRCWNFAAFPVRNGPAVIGVAAVVEDITERKAVETELRLLAAVVENSGEFIGICSPDQEPLYLNEAGRRMVGLTSWDEVAKTPLTDYFWPDDRPLFESRVVPALAKGERWSGEVRLRHFRTGEPIHTILDAFAIKDAEGQPIAWATNSPNLNSLKRAEALLREADRRKNEFLAMLGHELRNPLVPIRNAMEIMRASGSLDPKRQWACDVVRRQVEHLARLVDDLLDVSRIVQGKLALHKTSLDLADALDRAIEASKPLIEERGQTLEIFLPVETLWVHGDSVRLTQAVSNLLNNAAKYTPPGGLIRLELARDGEAATVSVRDNGAGISKALLPRIFNVFAQSNRTLDRAGGGLGLGLTIVRNITEMHGGRVEAHSQGAGLGSEFVLRLPLSKAPSSGG